MQNYIVCFHLHTTLPDPVSIINSPICIIFIIKPGHILAHEWYWCSWFCSDIILKVIPSLQECLHKWVAAHNSVHLMPCVRSARRVALREINVDTLVSTLTRRDEKGETMLFLWQLHGNSGVRNRDACMADEAVRGSSHCATFSSWCLVFLMTFYGSGQHNGAGVKGYQIMSAEKCHSAAPGYMSRGDVSCQMSQHHLGIICQMSQHYPGIICQMSQSPTNTKRWPKCLANFGPSSTWVYAFGWTKTINQREIMYGTIE